MIDVDLGSKKLNDLAAAVVAECFAFYRLPETLDIYVQAVEISDHVDGEADAICKAGEDGSYLIGLDDELQYSRLRLVELIAHEMTHVKQYVKGEVSDISSDGATVKYRGKYYRNQNELEYWLAPWEMEARAMQEFFIMRMVKNGWDLC